MTIAIAADQIYHRAADTQCHAVGGASHLGRMIAHSIMSEINQCLTHGMDNLGHGTHAAQPQPQTGHLR